MSLRKAQEQLFKVLDQVYRNEAWPRTVGEESIKPSVCAKCGVTITPYSWCGLFRFERRSKDYVARNYCTRCCTQEGNKECRSEPKRRRRRLEW